MWMEVCRHRRTKVSKFWTKSNVENINVIYLVRLDPSLFPPISHCLILPTKLLTTPTYFHRSASVLYKPLYRPLFFSIVLDSKPSKTVWIK
jgi:hypothetical protein